MVIFYIPVAHDEMQRAERVDFSKQADDFVFGHGLKLARHPLNTKGVVYHKTRFIKHKSGRTG